MSPESIHPFPANLILEQEVTSARRAVEPPPSTALTGRAASQETEKSLLDRLHSSLRQSFVALPNDPHTAFTDDQLSALFGGDVAGALRELARLALTYSQEDSHVT